MAAPVIDDRVSILAFEEGEVVSIQLSATNSPTSWTATTLPAGLTINTSTGLISGTLTASANIYHSTIQATNADPATGELALVFAIRKGPVLPSDAGLKVALDMDVLSKLVSVDGVAEDHPYGPATPQQRETGRVRPLLPLTIGERIDASVGLRRYGLLQDFVLNSLSLKVSNFEGEDQVELFSGLAKVGSGTDTRFEATLTTGDAVDDLIEEYESPLGTFGDLFAVLTVEILKAGNEYDTTQSDAFTAQKGSTATDTLVFTGVPKVTSVTRYTFELDLSVTAHTAQSVSLTVTADIAYDAATELFVISNQAGTTSGQGTDEGGSHWRSTFTLESITGTADGVDVEVKTVASPMLDRIVIESGANSGEWSIVSDLVSFPGPTFDEDFNAFDSEGPPLSSPWVLEDGDSAADIKTKLNGLGSINIDNEVSDVEFVGGDIVVYLLAGYETSDYVGDESGSFTPVPGPTDSEASTHSVQLAGNAADDVQVRKSEEFIIRISRGV